MNEFNFAQFLPANIRMIGLVLVFSVECVPWSAARRKSKSDQCQKLIYWSKPDFGCETVFTFLYILGRAEFGRQNEQTVLPQWRRMLQDRKRKYQKQEEASGHLLQRRTRSLSTSVFFYKNQTHSETKICDSSSTEISNSADSFFTLLSDISQELVALLILPCWPHFLPSSDAHKKQSMNNSNTL